jgi:hypothetical protein
MVASASQMKAEWDELLAEEALTEIHRRGPSQKEAVHPLADVLVKPQPKSLGRISGFEI